MKIYLLVVLMSWFFGGISNQPVYEKVVASPEHAAFIVWEYQQNADDIEPQHYKGRLFEIQIENTPPDRFRVKETMIKEIKIPSIEFKYEDKKIKKCSPPFFMREGEDGHYFFEIVPMDDIKVE